MSDNKIYWVRGNTQELLIPLEQEIVPQDGDIEVVPYYPDQDATVTVRLVGKYRKMSYTPQVDGNILRFTEGGAIPAGVYGVEVLVNNPDGTHYRSLWENQIVVTNQNDSVLQEWDEFRELDVKARAAVFFFAKGDKGDAFTYEDFTQEQIEGLKKPAYDAAEELTQEVHTLEEQFTAKENERKANESQRQNDEQERQSAESSRELKSEEDHAQAIGDHTQYEQDHTKELQRQESEGQRQQAESLRVNAEDLRNANESKRQQSEQEREETFATYEPKIDAKLDMITQEQFNQIFE